MGDVCSPQAGTGFWEDYSVHRPDCTLIDQTKCDSVSVFRVLTDVSIPVASSGLPTMALLSNLPIGDAYEPLSASWWCYFTNLHTIGMKSQRGTASLEKLGC